MIRKGGRGGEATRAPPSWIHPETLRVVTFTLGSRDDVGADVSKKTQSPSLWHLLPWRWEQQVFSLITISRGCAMPYSQTPWNKHLTHSDKKKPANGQLVAYSCGETADKPTMKPSMTISLVTFHTNSTPTVPFRGCRKTSSKWSTYTYIHT
jgi:hypothetical protein